VVPNPARRDRVGEEGDEPVTTEPELPRQDSAAMVLGGPTVLVDLGGLRILSDPTHGWAHFSEGRGDLARAFDDAGLSKPLRLGDHGQWIPLRPALPARDGGGRA
jgi:hypothetical protein